MALSDQMSQPRSLLLACSHLNRLKTFRWHKQIRIGKIMHFLFQNGSNRARFVRRLKVDYKIILSSYNGFKEITANENHRLRKQRNITVLKRTIAMCFWKIIN